MSTTRQKLPIETAKLADSDGKLPIETAKVADSDGKLPIGVWKGNGNVPFQGYRE